MRRISILLLSVGLMSLTACGDQLLSAAEEQDTFEAENKDENPNTPEQQKVCGGVVNTTSSSLNVRQEPAISNNVCGKLEKGASVTLVTEEPINGFFKIKTTLCEEGITEAYASSDYIVLNEDCDGDRDPASNPLPAPGVGKITDLSSYIQNNLERVATTRPLTRGGASGFVEVFRFPGQGENLLCGIKHIRGFRSPAYLGKDSLCAWTAITQEWKQQHCEGSNKDCRIMMGDASFGAKLPSSWPHSTHRRGWCMDIWPMRKKGCGEDEVTWRSSCYDRQKTKDFVKLLIKHGADVGNQFFFNDPQISETRPLVNHDDHIHVCFKPSNSRVKAACGKTVVDKATCPEFK